MNKNALFNLSYGLFVLTAKNEYKDNGCIINTVMQVTESPLQLCICVNKQNYTCQMLRETKAFNLSILSEKADFEVFKGFGFRSGTQCDKFEGVACERAKNGILYLTEQTNAYISCKITSETDLGTHIMFIATVEDAEILSDDASVTYAYYHKNIKPAPKPVEKKSYVCKICGYVYEGEELPDDFICPWCKHGASDFELRE